MQRTSRIVLLAVSLFIALGIVTGGVILAQSPMAIPLAPQNNSGESGTATLTDLGNGKVRVDVEIAGAPAGVPQPMHIHNGTCETLDPAPTFPLTSLVDGKSSTELNTTIAELMSAPYAINGHKSAAEASVYVFCGNISEIAMQATVTGTAGTETPAAGATTAATDAATAAATTGATEAATTAATTAATESATTAATEAATAAATTEAATAVATTTETMVAGAATTTPSAEATVTPSLPSTGADSPVTVLIPLAALGLLMLLVGLAARRMVR